MIEWNQLIWHGRNLVDMKIKVNGQVKSIFTDWERNVFEGQRE